MLRAERVSCVLCLVLAHPRDTQHTAGLTRETTSGSVDWWCGIWGGKLLADVSQCAVNWIQEFKQRENRELKSKSRPQ
jgi:hypothetical protein